MPKNYKMRDHKADWLKTMNGNRSSRTITAHEDPFPLEASLRNRVVTEEMQDSLLSAFATRASGSGNRPIEEEPDSYRTCFERDRDRVLHSSAFRRLAGKTQVFIFPSDHQRTRLTHALEVSQVALAISRRLGLNPDLTEAIALGHDCGHGPGGHASEEAFEPFLPTGFDHAPWGAFVTLTRLNLCSETSDGIANHSWSRPKPATPEGEVVSLADRIAYCAHDLEDAIHAGIIKADRLPEAIAGSVGAGRNKQLDYFIRDVVTTTVGSKIIGLSPEAGETLAAIRQFNYEQIYSRPDSRRQSEMVIDVLTALTEYFIANPRAVPDLTPGVPESVQAVAYVNGMTDRFAFHSAIELLDWPRTKIPNGIDLLR